MKFIKKIQSSELFKITSLNGVSILIKIAIGLITSKILAVFVGPGGMALIGNFRNFLTSVESVSSLGFQNGIVKYVAENDKNESQLKKIISTLFLCLIGVSTVVGTVLFFFADYWNKKVFGENVNYFYVFKILAIAIPFYVASLYLIAIINGLGKFKKVIYINILGNILGLVITAFFVFNYNVYGALLSIVITPSLLFFISLFYLSGEILVTKFLSLKILDFSILKNLSHYFIMAMIPGILGPIVSLFIRNHLIEATDLTHAGYWEAMQRISAYYILFVNTLLMVYYYPKLVTSESISKTKSVVWSFYKNVLPLFTLGLIIIYFCKSLIIKILFAPAFEPVSKLFFWQLLGDLLRVVSLILGLQFFAKKMTKAFIITEITSLSISLISNFILINYFKTEGVVMAHALTYFVYLIVLIVYFRKNLI